jgi:hypothetical protein
MALKVYAGCLLSARMISPQVLPCSRKASIWAPLVLARYVVGGGRFPGWVLNWGRK